jgi:hypothetical protein
MLHIWAALCSIKTVNQEHVITEHHQMSIAHNVAVKALISQILNVTKHINPKTFLKPMFLRIAIAVIHGLYFYPGSFHFPYF